ncbi:DUF1641 domain-containing protein [Bacillus benzoevorans]|uniref:Uncharacterized protein YjgD (DUF1641 family) n=1 Tax=Bacillus benzoevorans TaxID=1456 RepID=A0A7X0HP99_9BACI|nr:DUF1641 domain-containing protein [Bacillus benzoevorans]MBB6444472.1 uncharacterized protein YjgD (DUF1641 family) [Bacillus benzoevorans]
MAKAIKQIEESKVTSQEKQSEDLFAIIKLVSENREAITTSMEILGELKQTGVLDMFKGALRTREKIGAIALEQINQPSMHNTIKNAFNIIEFLGSINPDQMKVLLSALRKGMDEFSESVEKNEHIGIWGMMRSIRDPKVNTVITSMLGFLNGVGQEVDKGPNA